ncbi:MAG TPA: hypothetical protein VKB14_17990, partial [Actinomycetales bacterium]|nr:hypothetical protein [Actinomycetales bacterium]
TRIELVWVESATDVAGTGFAVSPKLVVDRQDLVPGSAPVVQLAGQLYAELDRLRGSPTQQAMVETLSRLSATA